MFPLSALVRIISGLFFRNRLVELIDLESDGWCVDLLGEKKRRLFMIGMDRFLLT